MTLNDISQKTGVSVATVHRVLKKIPGVKASTRKKVLAVLHETDYDTTALAELQSFADAKKRIDVLICPLQEQHEPIAISYYVTTLEGIRSVLEPNRFDLQVNINILKKGREVVDFREHLDGIILVGFPSCSLVSQLEQGSIPYVIISNSPAVHWTELVSVDQYQESFQLIEKLTSLGIQRVGLLIPTIDCHVLNGVSAGLQFHGLKLAESDWGIAKNTDLSSFISPVQKLLAAETLPEAMICINRAVFQLYQEMLRNCRPGDGEKMLYVFFSDCPQRNYGKAIHIQIDSFKEGALGAEWLTNKIQKKRVRDNYRMIVPMSYVSCDAKDERKPE